RLPNISPRALVPKRCSRSLWRSLRARTRGGRRSNAAPRYRFSRSLPIAPADLEPSNRSVESGAPNPEPRAQNVEPGTSNPSNGVVVPGGGRERLPAWPTGVLPARWPVGETSFTHLLRTNRADTRVASFRLWQR